jgi:hypothetical protein
MSDATNRAKNLLSTLDREDSVSFYAVRGVLKECIAEIETQCTEGGELRAALESLMEQIGDCVENHELCPMLLHLVKTIREVYPSVSGKQK